MVPQSDNRTAELLANAAWIRALARRLVGDGPAADDLVQDTWLAALRHRPDTNRPLRPWLARVLRNFVRQAGRQRAALPELEMLQEADEAGRTAPTPEELVERGELQSLLVSAVLELREPFRATILLRYFEGLAPLEIARMQGVPGATVRSRLKRAIEELRGRLDDEHGGERSVWMTAFAPLVWVQPSIPGAILMKTTSYKTAAATAAVLLVLFGGHRAWTALQLPGQRAETEHTSSLTEPVEPAASAAAPLDDPSTRRTRGTRSRAGATSSAPANESPSWSGVLVDAATGEPLPNFLLEARSGDRRETLQTDGSGRFRAQNDYAPNVDLWLRDHPLLPRDARVVDGDVRVDERWIAHAIDAGPASDDEIPVDVGPTYPLDLRSEAPLEVDRLMAVVLGPGISFRNTLGSVASAPVRGRSAPWVRFAPLITGLLPSSKPWQLQLYDRDGFWNGVSDVRSIVGLYPEPVIVEMEARGRISGHARVKRGSGLAGVTVRLVPRDKRGEAISTMTGADGAYALEWAKPAVYEVVFESPRHVTWSTKKRVHKLETKTCDANLRELPNAGDITGQLTSRTGAYRNNVSVWAFGQEDGLPNLESDVVWREDARGSVGTFAFEDLPPGKYKVSVISFLDKFTWSPASAIVAPPADVRLECADDAPTLDISFDVLDAVTGEKLAPFELGYSINGSASVVFGGMSSEGPHIYSFPDGSKIDWMVHARGYAASFGDEDDLNLGGSDGLIAAVRLERGWRARILVRDAETGASVPGAAIVLDGVEAARTDATGRALVYSPSVPSVVHAVQSGRTGTLSSPGRVTPIHLIKLP